MNLDLGLFGASALFVALVGVMLGGFLWLGAPPLLDGLVYSAGVSAVLAGLFFHAARRARDHRLALLRVPPPAP